MGAEHITPKLKDIFIPELVIVDREKAQQAATEIRKNDFGFSWNVTSQGVSGRDKLGIYFDDKVREAVFIEQLRRMGVETEIV